MPVLRANISETSLAPLFNEQGDRETVEKGRVLERNGNEFHRIPEAVGNDRDSPKHEYPPEIAKCIVIRCLWSLQGLFCKGQRAGYGRWIAGMFIGHKSVHKPILSSEMNDLRALGNRFWLVPLEDKWR